MGDQRIRFVPHDLFYISWDNYFEENYSDRELSEDEQTVIIFNLTQEIENLIETNDYPFDFTDESFTPISGLTDINIYILALIEIIKFLDKNKISWAGEKLPFKQGDNMGFLYVDTQQYYVILGIIDSDLELKKRYINIYPKKL